MDKKAVLLERNKISKLLGTESQDDSLERNLLLLKSLDMQKDISGIISKVYTLIKQGQDDTQTLKDVKSEVCLLLAALDKYQDAFGKEVKVLVSNFPEAVREVRISNTQDFKQEHLKEIRVSNLKEIKPEKHPDEISIKRPVWYKDFDFDKLFKFSKESSAGFFNQIKAGIFNSFIKNAKPREAIPVRLVTEDGEKFYRAGNVFVAGGSGPTETAKRILKKTIILSGSGVVHTPAANKKISLFSVKFSLSVDMSAVSFRWTQGGEDFEKYLAPKAGGLYGANNHPDYIDGGIDEPLYCSISGSGSVQVNMDYLEL